MNKFTKVLLSVPLLLSTVACSAKTVDYRTNSGSTIKIERESVSCRSKNWDKYAICKAYGTEETLNGDVYNWSNPQEYCSNIPVTRTKNDPTCLAAIELGHFPQYRY